MIVKYIKLNFIINQAILPYISHVKKIKLLGRISYKKHFISITILLKKYEYEYGEY